MTDSPVITDAHIKRFQDRAKFHFALSYVILLGIIALFGVAIYIFLFAQQIDKSKGSVEVLQELLTGKADQSLVAQEAQKETDALLGQFQSGTIPAARVAAADEILIDASTKLKLFEEQINLMNQSGYVPDLDTPHSKEELTIIEDGKQKIKDEADRILRIVQQQFNGGYAITQADVSEAQRLVDQDNLELELAQQRASVALPAAQLKQVTTGLDTLELIRTSLVRFGGVAVTLFLISLLTPIYRYNVRLATFYQARADSLLLCRDTYVDDFATMTTLFTPVYGFDKEPRTPVESIASVIKDAGETIRKTS